MNETTSILLATTILALSGLGLYMYKSSDENQKEESDDYNEDSIFGGEFWGSSNDDEEKLEEVYDEDYKPRKRGQKTIKNRKSTGSSRRRYY